MAGCCLLCSAALLFVDCASQMVWSACSAENSRVHCLLCLFTQMTDWWYMSHTEAGPRHPSYDAHFATALGQGGEPQGQVNYYVQVGA